MRQVAEGKLYSYIKDFFHIQMTKNIARGSAFSDHLTHYASAHMGPEFRWSPIQVVTKAQYFLTSVIR